MVDKLCQMKGARCTWGHSLARGKQTHAFSSTCTLLKLPTMPSTKHADLTVPNIFEQNKLAECSLPAGPGPAGGWTCRARSSATAAAAGAHRSAHACTFSASCAVFHPYHVHRADLRLLSLSRTWVCTPNSKDDGQHCIAAVMAAVHEDQECHALHFLFEFCLINGTKTYARNTRAKGMLIQTAQAPYCIAPFKLSGGQVHSQIPWQLHQVPEGEFSNRAALLHP